MTVLVVAHLYVLERPVKSDEGGFLNPVLEFLHTGRVVYPAHGPEHAQTMIVHPPVHYRLTGLLMKTGLNFYPAAVTIVLIVWMAFIAAMLTAPWPDLLKLSFLIAAFIPNFVLIDLDPSRSELQMAIAWLTALVLLESSRLTSWGKLKLFLGSFLLAYASGLHYFALPASAGLLVYAVWMLRDLGWRAGSRRGLFLVAGAAMFFVPYLLLFLVPEYSAIRQLIAALNAASGPLEGLRGGIWKAFQEHRQTYPASYGFIFPSPEEYRSVFLLLLKPFLLRGIPVVFVSTPLLLLWRETRGLAIAALPFQLSLLLFFHHKSVPYYRGEFSLFYAGLLALLLCGLDWIWRRSLGTRGLAWWTAAAGLAASIVLVADSRVWQIRDGAVFVDELALARAAGKAVLGNSAVVGGRSVCLWYTSGARYYRNFVSDLLYPPDISNLDVRAFFDTFDSVAEEPAGSWLTYNRQKLGIPSWYVNGTLQLQGFYAGRVQRGWQYSYYLAGTGKKRPLQAYFWRGRKFFRFLEDPDGSSAVMSIVSPHGRAWLSLGNEGLYLMAVAIPPDEQTYVTFHVVSRDQAVAFQNHPAPNSQVREVVFGRVQPVDPVALLSTVDYHREMAQIFYTTPELLATQVTAGAGQAIPLRNVLPGGPTVASDGNNPALRYISPPVASAGLLYSPEIDLKDPGAYLLSFRLRIRSGKLAITVIDPQTHSNLAQLIRYHSQPALTESVLLGPQIHSLQVLIWANNAKAEKTDFEIAGLQFAQARRNDRRN